jgi:acyl-CoA thioester hydrolase
MHRFELRVRYADVDQMGWAYYGNYLRWFEIGRAEMLRALGRSYREIEDEAGVLLPVLEARCRYQRGARYDERVTIETGVLARGRASVCFGYRVLGEDGETCALGFTEHGYVTREGRAARPPAGLAGLLAAAPAADAQLAAWHAAGGGSSRERRSGPGALSS